MSIITARRAISRSISRNVGSSVRTSIAVAFAWRFSTGFESVTDSSAILAATGACSGSNSALYAALRKQQQNASPDVPDQDLRHGLLMLCQTRSTRQCRHPRRRCQRNADTRPEFYPPWSPESPRVTAGGHELASAGQRQAGIGIAMAMAAAGRTLVA